MREAIMDYTPHIRRKKTSPWGKAAIFCLSVVFLIYLLDVGRILPNTIRMEMELFGICVFLVGFLLSIIGLFKRRFNKTLPYTLVSIHIVILIFGIILMVTRDKDIKATKSISGPVGIVKE